MGLVREIQVDLSSSPSMTATALFDSLDMDTDALFDFEENPLGDPLFDDNERFALQDSGFPPKLKVDIEQVLDVLAVARDAEPEAEAEAAGDGLEVIEQLGDDLLQALENFSAAPTPATIALAWGSRGPSALELSGAVIIRNQGTRSAAEARAKQLKERHNANERRRTNAARDRIREMRDQVSALERQRAQLSASSTQASKVAAPPLSQELTAPLELGCGIPSESAYLELVAAVDALRKEKTYLKERIDVYDAQHSVVQGFHTEVSLEIDGKSFGATGAVGSGIGQENQSMTTQKKKNPKKKNGSDSDDAIDGDNSSDSDESSIGWAEPTPTYLKVLFETPLTTEQAFGWVKQSYDEIMALKNHSRFESSGSPTFGWSDRRVVEADSLQFMFDQDFRGALASEFVYKTWNLLTVHKSYKLIQPRTTGLRVLQRINDDCVVVRLSVASTQDDVFHTIMVVARGQIDSGYLISYRSIPLSEGQSHFAETEGTYVSVFNWFMFIDKFDQDDRPVCEVIFGGRVANRSAKYLRYLTMEVVAGIVRWQTAVGQSRFSLSL